MCNVNDSVDKALENQPYEVSIGKTDFWSWCLFRSSTWTHIPESCLVFYPYDYSVSLTVTFSKKHVCRLSIQLKEDMKGKRGGGNQWFLYCGFPLLLPNSIDTFKTRLSSRTFCRGDPVLLHHLEWQPLALCGYWAFEMCLTFIREQISILQKKKKKL